MPSKLADAAAAVAARPMPATALKRRLGLVLWCAAAGWLGFTAWRLWGAEPSWFFVVIMAYTPYLIPATLIPLGVALWLRHWRSLPVFATCAVVLALLVAPRLIIDDTAAVDGPRLRVMTANALMGRADLDTVVSLVSEHEIDVLSLQELTPGAAKALRDAGMAQELPHKVEHTGTMADGTGIYSRHPITELPEHNLDGIFWMPAVAMELPNAPQVQFTAVHIAAPASAERIPDWRRELAAIPPPPANGPIHVLAGDFNATLDHAALRGVLDAGYRDSAEVTGNGLAGTWHQLKAPLPITLDHVLADPRATAVNTMIETVPGSDHSAVIAEIALPAEF